MKLFGTSKRSFSPLRTPSVLAPGLSSGPSGVWAWCSLPMRSTDAIPTAELLSETVVGAADLRQVLPRDVDWHIKVQWSRYGGSEHYATEAARWANGVPAGADRYLQVQAQRLDDLGLPRRQVLLGVRLDEPPQAGKNLLASAPASDAEKRAHEHAVLAGKWHARMAGTSFAARRASVRELAWALRRDIRRTVGWLPPGPLAGPGEVARLRSGETVVESDHVQIMTDDGVRYLRCLVSTVNGFPADGLVLPGGEWLRDLLIEDDDPDNPAEPIELSVRGQSLSNARANRRISTALKLVKEQGREASRGVAEEPPDAVLDAREALMQRQADIGAGGTSMIEDSPVWIVEADSLDALEARSQQVIDTYAARQIDLFAAPHLQGELWRSTVLGDTLRVPDFRQFRPMSTLVGSWFHGGSMVGGSSGPLLGYSTGSTPTPYRDRYSDAALAGQPVTSAFLGESGAGKSTGLMLATLAEARYGAWAFLLDMKGDLGGIVNAAEMFDVPTVTLAADAVIPGSACPFGYMPVEASSQMNAQSAVLDTLMMALRPGVGASFEPAIRRACWQVAEYPNPEDRSTHAVIETLAADRDEQVRALGAELQGLARDPLFQPIAGAPAPQRQGLPTGSGLTYMSFPSGQLPERGSLTSDWSPSARLAMTLLRGIFRYVTYMSTRVRGIPKVIALPELHRITGYEVGRAMVKEVALMGRALDTSRILDTQACVELEQIEGLSGQLSNVLAFRVSQDAEAAAQARMLNRTADAEFIARQKRLAKGECVVRDRREQTSTVYFDRLAAEVADALNTTPERLSEREELAG
ncbi:MAG: ATP-binding protein [Cumulibacter sp.]